MTHPEIEQGDIIERYVRRQLAPDVQQAFEDHFFGCDECFGKVQDMERFVAGVRDASDRGLLGADSGTQPRPEAPGWVRWAFATSACASVALAVVAGWLYFSQIRGLRNQVERTAAELEVQRAARTRLESRVNPADAPESNVALVMLAASRAGETPATAVLAPGARRLVLWIDMAASRFQTFRLQVTAADGRTIATLDDLRRSGYGALVASVPADQLPVGEVRITLSGQDPPPAALVGDYQLRIEKH